MFRLLMPALVVLVLVGLVTDAPAQKQKGKKPDTKEVKKSPGKSPFPDKKLEEAVRDVLHEPSGDLTDQKLLNVYVLEAKKKGIRDLAGLEKCKNLAQLVLAGNEVANLNALKDLKNLQSLDLAGNKLANLTPLEELTKLQFLDLSDNQIADLKPLANLTSLTSLYGSGNKVKDLAPLAALTRLSSLSLGRNQIQDLDPLAKVNRLMTLDLTDNQIANIAPLAKQTELSLLMLDRNKIDDLGPLVAAAKADAAGAKRFAPYLRLYLTGNPLKEATANGQLKALEKIGVRINPKTS
ncbi:MAG: leucine-rich repeat domain-containing protein [Gemmataceae bacterium]|nr:leucine-rich repeat domain-containing protein [Gemmataceae bacterium]